RGRRRAAISATLAHRKKKKRGRSKLFKSCFRSFANDERPFLNHNNNSDSRSRLGEEDDVGVQDVNYERSSSNRSVPRLLKAVLFDPVMVKKIFSSSKSSTISYTNNTICKQLDDSNASCIESTDIEDSSSSRCSTLLSSSSRATIYGRIYAILCTSIWFYMVPGRRVTRVNSVTNSSKVIDTESEQYKKRVIMADSGQYLVKYLNKLTRITVRQKSFCY
ncbi:hypothetical protein M8C21_011963, partial [Ambrosia artemisiifolia]